MELFFAKILNGFQLLTIFAKNLHHRCSTGLKIGFRLRALNTELTLVPSLQIKPKKYSAGKYMWHHFWKGQRSWWNSKHECLCRSSRLMGSLKKVLWEISQNSQENIYAEISLLMFPCEFCKICENTFLQNRTGRLFLILAVSIVAKGVLVNESVNYDTKTKAYVLIWARSVSY